MARDREEIRSAAGVSEGGTPHSEGEMWFADACDILRHRTNRRILSYLLRQDDPISVATLARNVIAEQTPSASAGTGTTRNNEAEDATS